MVIALSTVTGGQRHWYLAALSLRKCAEMLRESEVSRGTFPSSSLLEWGHGTCAPADALQRAAKRFRCRIRSVSGQEYDGHRRRRL